MPTRGRACEGNNRAGGAGSPFPTAGAQDALGIGELSRLGWGTVLPRAAQRVGIEGDRLARFARLLGSRGRWTRTSHLPQSDRRAIRSRFCVSNWCVSRTRPFGYWTSRRHGHGILCWISTPRPCQTISAISCCLGINLATGALPDAIIDAIMSVLGDNEAETAPSDADLPAPWERSRAEPYRTSISSGGDNPGPIREACGGA